MAEARRERWIAFLLILPSIILIAIFVYGFIGWTTTVALSKWDGVKPDYTWVGLDNFKMLFTEAGGISAFPGGPNLQGLAGLPNSADGGSHLGV